MPCSTERMAGVRWTCWGRNIGVGAVRSGTRGRTNAHAAIGGGPLQSGVDPTARNAMAFMNYVTQIQLDFGAVKLLPQECERIGIKRPLVVTDKGVRAAGVLQQALDAM